MTRCPKPESTSGPKSPGPSARIRPSRARPTLLLCSVALCAFAVPAVQAQERDADRFAPEDVFSLEWASDPQISPDGSRVVYVRNGFDVMKDASRSALWIVDSDGTRHRALTTGAGSAFSPRWSPDGSRLAYVSTEAGSPQVWIRWMDDGQTALLTNLTGSPGSLTWSPNGEWLAMTMFVPDDTQPMTAPMPRRPEGAEWAPPAKVIERINYRFDGAGYLPRGQTHIFVLPADGGTPRQLTSGTRSHGGPLSWTPDSRSIVFSANLHDTYLEEPLNSEVYRLDLAGGEVTALTDRFGPDGGPAVSPDGSLIAYTGFDDDYQGYQVSGLYVMRADGSNPRILTGDLDRDVADIQWTGDGTALLFQYDDRGNTRVARASLDGQVTDLATNLGGLSLGRPYGGGQLSASRDGVVAYTHTTPIPKTHYYVEKEYASIDEGMSEGPGGGVRKVGEQIQAVGAEHCILSTDCGVYTLPPPVEGMREFIACMLDLGITVDQIRRMISTNPKILLGIE